MIPAFNAMAYLPVAVQSVLDQTLQDWEMIVVDDGSTDTTREYVSSLRDGRIALIALEHCGNQSRARNAGICEARGRYVAFLDADDAWSPRKLEIQLAALEADDACRWSYTAVQRIDASGAPLEHVGIQPWVPYEGWILDHLLRVDALIATPAVVVELSMLDEVGGFDEALRFCQQYDLWFRLAMRSPVRAHDERLTYVRVHGESYTRDRLAVHASWEQLYVKTARVLSEPRLRKVCTERRAAHVVTIADIHTTRRQVGKAAQTLIRASPYAWRYGRWWRAWIRAMVRPFVPHRLVTMLRGVISRGEPRTPAV